MDLFAPGPLHQLSAPTTAWTTVNTAENIPGVLTPLGADFFVRAANVGMFGAFHLVGVLPRSEVRDPECADDRCTAVVCGRLAGNIDSIRRLIDLTPGGDGAKFEEAIFGSLRTGIPAHTNRLRYPIVALKAPGLVAGYPRRMTRRTTELRRWWRRVTSDDPGLSSVGLLREAHALFARAVAEQMVSTMIAQAFYDKLGALAESVGRPEDKLALVTGYGDLEEARMISALHEVAHRGRSLADFLAVYGARCPGENEISAHSWRERPEQVEKLARKYRDAPGRGDPAASAHERTAERVRVEREVLALLPRHRRPGARLLLRLARTYIPLREKAKNLMAMSMDGGRCAARRRGVELADAGVIDHPEDVFLLTLAEITGDPPADARDLVVQRRELRAAYEGHQLPVYWIGDAEPVPVTEPSAERVASVSGMPASAGIVAGRARVMADADGIDDLEDGEILVCRTTDPSWGAAFHLVSAAVIDIGGPSSHGAIVSRELGLPCVINTGNGTTLLRTGDLLRVDGAAGIVTVLEPAATELP